MVTVYSKNHAQHTSREPKFASSNPAEAVGYFTAKKKSFFLKGSNAVCPMSHICGM